MRFTKLPILILALGAIPAFANPIVVPPGLSPGSTYRLIFITSANHDATSNDIGVYNTFVTNVANSVPELAALGTTWAALASTGLVNALDNAGLNRLDANTPFYNTAGGLIATGVADGAGRLYDGLSTAHANPIFYEDGAAPDQLGQFVWTGTLSTGGRDPFRHLGAGPGVTVVLGAANETNLYWTDANSESPNFTLHLYGISDDLTVPSDVPEPSTLALLGGGLLLLGRLKRSRNQ